LAFAPVAQLELDRDQLIVGGRHSDGLPPLVDELDQAAHRRRQQRPFTQIAPAPRCPFTELILGRAGPGELEQTQLEHVRNRLRPYSTPVVERWRAQSRDEVRRSAERIELVGEVPREHTRGGSLPRVQLGRYIRYRREAILTWLESQEGADMRRGGARTTTATMSVREAA
jgi:hypothetical protein